MIRSILIADDEPSAREYLIRLLKQQESYKLMGSMKNGQEVIDFCKTLEPDIIILDIEMPGIDGLSAARQISKKLSQSVIIFITAYDQYAIEAFEHAAVAYLLKPFDEQSLRRVLNQANKQLQLLEKASFNDQMIDLWDKLERKTQTSLATFDIIEKGLINKLDVIDILYLESDSEYTRLVTMKKTYTQRLAIKTLDMQLPSEFRRIHRSFIINQQHIQSWKYINGRFEFVMTNKNQLISSRSYKQQIREWLQ